MTEQGYKSLDKIPGVSQLLVVGKNIRRLDSLDKVLGRPIYTADIITENTLHCRAVRSKVTHALIKGANFKQALKIPGVVAVLTARDIPGINESTALLPDKPLLALDRVRFHGEPFAVVVADDPVTAEEAAELVTAEYAPLPAVFDPVEAMGPQAPKIHDGGNVAKHVKLRKGDIEKGFREAHVIVENTYKTPFQEPVPLEPEAGLVIPERDGTVTCVGSMQSPFHVQTGIAKILGLKPEQVRVVQAATGGAFGPKSDEIPVDVCGMAAIAAVKTGKPAVLAYSREESMIGHTKRHPFIITQKTGATRDGKLTAVQTKLVADTGAYASLGPLVVIRATFHATGPYLVPHVKTDSYCVYTNNTMAGSFRGFGGPQSHYAAECQMDEVAKKLGMDPLDFRLLNILRPGTLTATSQVVDQACGLEECTLRAAKESDWYNKRRPYSSSAGPIRRGIGIALMYHGNSLGPEGNDFATVHVHIDSGGIIHLRTALTEYGTGAPSGLVQIAAETLGLPMEYFVVEPPDTSECTDPGPTVASRTITIGGRATQDASGKLKAKLAQVASGLLNCKPEEVEVRDGEFRKATAPLRTVDYQTVVKEGFAKKVALKEKGYFNAPRCDFEEETSQGTTYHQYTYGAVVADVEVDTEIGSVKVLRIVTAYDVGKVINPLSLEGQIEGGTVQGLGYGLMEELIHKDGVVLNPELCNYYIPTSVDIPEIKNIIVEYPGALGPFGAKAMGEPPVDLPAPAVANAIAHALGVRIFDIPITPDKVVRARN